MLENTDINPISSQPKRKRSWLALLSILAVILAIVCWFQLIHQQKRATHNYSQLQSSFTQSQLDNAALNQQFTQLKAQLDQQQQTITTLQATLNRLQNFSNNHQLDQALQEIDHNIQQANVALLFNHNTDIALALLQYADQRISQLPQAQLIPLRQALAKSITALQAVPKVDQVGTLSQLAALRDQVSVLPLFAVNGKVSQFSDNAAAVNSASKAPTFVEKTWRVSLETLKSLVIIRHRSEPIEPLVAPIQEQFLRQNLQMILQQTQWAVLQHDNKLYEFSLNQAKEWLQRYFADNNSGTQALLQTIETLSDQNIDPQLPNLAPLLNQAHQTELAISKSHNIFGDDQSIPANSSTHTAEASAAPTTNQDTTKLPAPEVNKALTKDSQPPLAQPGLPQPAKGALV